MKTAVAIQQYKRPEYTKELYETIEHCVKAETVDWYIFQLGNPDEDGVQLSHRLAKELDVPNKSIIYPKESDPMIKGRDRIYSLFDQGYTYVIVLENDIRVSTYMIPVLRSLMKQFPAAVASLYAERHHSTYTLPDELSHAAIADYGRAFCRGVPAHVFERLRPGWERIMAVYEDNGGRWPRDVETVQHLFEEPLSTDDELIGPDNAFALLCGQNRIPFVHPTVSRASYIGREGAHSNPDLYDQNTAFGNEGRITYERDRDPDRWDVIMGGRQWKTSPSYREYL